MRWSGGDWMPYKYPDNVPDAIKGLPTEAQKTWIAIYNSAHEQYKDNSDKESISMAVAWAGLRRAGWEQKDGKWVKVAKQKENPIMQTKSIQKEWSMDFVKVEEEKRLVTGIVIEPEVEDTYGDVISIDEIEKAMIRFMEGNQQIRIEHDPNYTPKVVIIENWIEREGRMIGEQFVKIGTWLMTTKVFDDDVWDMIKSGKLNGYSFRGPGIGVIESEVI